MKSLGFRQALEKIRDNLIALANTDSVNTLLGMTGYVASGKSWFSKKLQTDATAILRKEVIYLPFDLWINREGLNSLTYAGRFLLDDFAQAIKCIRNGEQFLVPRYDIIKRVGTQRAADQLATQQVMWNKKVFVRSSQDFNSQVLPGSIGLYVEVKSGYLYSLFPAISGKAFLIDGTLIFPPQATNHYHLKVFIQASWPLRVARMIRRFNRKEVFGATSQSVVDYVGFLVEEARLCADQEIWQQVDDSIVLVKSMPETLSNYLDLAYLREYIESSRLPHWVTLAETEETMQSFLDSIRSEHDPERLNLFRQELIALIESKHLLAVANVDQILSELARVIL